jgi:adenylate cyclase
MGPFRKFIQKPFVVILAGGLLVFSLVTLLRNTGSLEFLELAAYDLFVRMDGKLSRDNKRITLVEISEGDIRKTGHWPLPDATIAHAIKQLLRGAPRAIGVDIYRDIPVPPGTEELHSVFAANPHVIGVMTVGDKGIAPIEVIKNTDQAAFGDIVIDPDGIVRRGLLFLDDGQNSYTSFALRLASLYLEKDGIGLQPDLANPQCLRLGGATIRPMEKSDGGYWDCDARGYQFLLDFQVPRSLFRTYSFSDLISGNIPEEAVKDRIVLIGVNAQSVKDHFFTPVSKEDVAGEQVPGVVLHGMIADQFIRLALEKGIPMQAPHERLKHGWLLFWAILGSAIGFVTRSARRFTLFISGALLSLITIAYLAFTAGWWIPLVPPALSLFISTVVITAYMTGLEKRERAVLMQIFSKHVSREVAEMIWLQRDQFLENGRPRSQNMTVTVFFSDLKGFTSVSEKMEPAELIDWLNTYMESMATLIMTHGGVVDDYAGDGIKADFGVPVPRNSDEEISKDAVNAVNCAIAMEKEMYRLNAEWKEKGHPEVGVRIGIFTGPVVGGLLGSSQRLKYTTIGDTVNIASRLESYDKEVGRDSLCRILIGESTLQCLGNRYRTEEIGEVSLKGKNERIIVHRILEEETVTI